MLRMPQATVAAAVFCFTVLLGGCNPFGTDLTVIEHPGSVPAFMIPANGATIAKDTELAVSGVGIQSVRFEVDGSVLYEDTSAPFAWTLTPAGFTSGEHRLSVVARRDEVLFQAAVTVSPVSLSTVY